MQIIGFTGHRPNRVGEGLAAQNHLVSFARDVVSELQPRRALIGMAQGWDQAVAQACVDERIPFLAVVPFVGQHDRWSIEDKRRYHRLLDCASEIITVSTSNVPAIRAMQLRNEWIVDHCESLVALWDGTPSGTANCVNYAAGVNRPVQNIWNRWRFNLSADLWALVA